MKSPFTLRNSWSPSAALALLALLSNPFADVHGQTVEQVRPGARFTAESFSVFNPGSGSAEVDLSAITGVKPIVLFYWIPGNPRAGAVFQDLLELNRELGRDKLAVFGVAVPNPGIGVTLDVVRQKIDELGVDVPVLIDDEFAIGRMLGVRSVPNITIIDKDGRLRLSNGASLQQDLEYKVDLRAAIGRVAASGSLHNYGYLEQYYPVTELEGHPAPDFTAAQISDSVERRWHTLIDEEKVNVLIFWSVDCPHCRTQLPKINEWLKANPEQLNVVGCATVASDSVKKKTRDFCELNELAFPNLIDHEAEISELYGVTTTPTIVIVGPDGVVDSAITSSVADFGTTMTRKKRELL